MFELIFFGLGALLMFGMGLRSRAQRKKLCASGASVKARVSGTVQSREGWAYLLEFETETGSHRLPYPKPARGEPLQQGGEVQLYYDPQDPSRMYVEGDKAVRNAELFYFVLGGVLVLLLAVSQFY